MIIHKQGMGVLKLVHEMIWRSAERTPDALSIKDPVSELTYQQFVERMDSLKRALRLLKLPFHARVIIILPNSVEFLIAHFAILAAGGISVPCDYFVSDSVLEKIIRNCEPTAIVTNAGIHQKLLASSLVTKNIFFLLTEGSNDASQYHTFEGMFELGANVQVNVPDIHEDDIATLMYTTGSTGTPKGVVLTHKNILSALNNICRFIGYKSADREVIILPISHNFGLGHVYCNLMSGGAVYTEHGMVRVKRVLTMLESFKATGFPGTPTSYGILLDRYRDIFIKKAKSLRFIVINSAPLPPDRAAQIIDQLPGVNLMVYYGLTEASRSTFISLSQKGPMYFQSVGKPLDDIQLCIQDEAGNKLPPKQIGQVWVLGSFPK